MTIYGPRSNLLPSIFSHDFNIMGSHIAKRIIFITFVLKVLHRERNKKLNLSPGFILSTFNQPPYFDLNSDTI